MTGDVKKRVRYIFVIVVMIMAFVFLVFSFSKEKREKNFFIVNTPSNYDESLVVATFDNFLNIRPVNAERVDVVHEDENTVRYFDAYKDTDVEQIRYADKLKESLILKGPNHPKRFEYIINIEDYTWEIAKNGDILFREKKPRNLSKFRSDNGKKIPENLARLFLDEKQVIFRIPKPFMVEYVVGSPENLLGDVGEVRVEITGNKLALIPDENWIRGHEYPILVDPTVEVEPRPVEEVSDNRTLTGVTFRNNNGTFTYKSIMGEVINYEDEEGALQPIDLELEEVGFVGKLSTGYDFFNEENTFQSYFKKNSDKGDNVRFEKDDMWISFTILDSPDFGERKKVDGEINGNEFVYKDMFGTTDVKYIVSATEVREEYILEEYRDIDTLAQEITFSEAVELRQEDGKIVFYSRENSEESIFQLPKPVMYEVNLRDREMRSRDGRIYTMQSRYENYGLHYEVEKKSDTNYVVTKVLDQVGKEWLADESRVYPVVVDDTWGPTGIQADNDDGNDVDEGSYDNWYTNGYPSSNGAYIFKSGTDFNYPGYSWELPAIGGGSTINKFYMRAYQYNDGGTVNNYRLVTQNSDPATATIWSSSNRPSDASWINNNSTDNEDFSNSAWYFGESDTVPWNLNDDLQDLITSYGDVASGDRVNIAIHATGDTSSYAQFEDYSHSGSNQAQLSIDWLENSATSFTDPTSNGTGSTCTNPSDAYTSNNVDAICNPTLSAGVVDVDNFGFAIDSSSIVGIEVRVEAAINSTPATYYVSCQLLDASGSTVGNSKTSSNWTGTSDVTYTLGGLSDMWGTTLTESDIEDADFGVRCTAVKSSGTSLKSLLIDNIDMRIIYSAQSNSDPTITSVSDTPDPQDAGNDVEFSVNWNDADSGENVKVKICKTDSLTGQNCDGGHYASSTSFTTDDPEAVSYTTTSADAGVNNYYAFVCDDEGACSSSSSGTFEVKPSWWNSSWGYRKKITLDNSDQTDAHIDFPVMVTSTSADTNFWSHVADGADDLRFVNKDGTELYFELEEWNSTSDEMLAWVKMPFLKSSTTDAIWMYYGNGSAATSTNLSATNVWNSDYKMVWHMSESSGTLQDSTSNNMDSQGVSGGTYSVSSPVGDGIGLADGYSSSYIYRSTNSDIEQDPFTWELWFEANEISSSNTWIWEMNGGEFDLKLLDGTSGDFETKHDSLTPTYLRYTDTGFNFAANTWYHIVATKHTSGDDRMKVYKNGELFFEDGGTNAPSGTINWGAFYMGYHRFGGTMDEIRISSGTRSADWIAFEYCNMTGGCMTYGSEEVPNSTPTVSSVSDSPDPIGVGSAVTFSVDWSDDDTDDLQKVYICKTDAFSSGCTGGEWTSSGSYGNKDPMELSYTTQAGDKGSSQNYYVYVCDDSGAGNACTSSGTSGSFTVQNMKPDAPVSLLVEGMGISGQAINIVDTTPEFSAVYKDSLDEGDQANKMCVLVQARPDSLASGLKGYWKIDTGSGTTVTDYSDSGNNGTLGYSDHWTTDGYFDGAYDFDGTDDTINMGDPGDGSLDFGTGDFTLAAWFWIDSLPGTWKSIINKGASGGDGYGMEISSGNLVTCSIDAVDGSNQHATGATPSTGEWHFLVCVFDRDDKIYRYLDGSADGSAVNYAAGNDNSVDTATTFKIGSYATTSWNFDGKIDEVAVWNRALSSTEVAALYKMWDQDSNMCNSGTTITTINEGDRSSDQTYAGTTLTADGMKYYWRTWLWDDDGDRSVTSTIGWFQVADAAEGGGVRLKGSRLKGGVRLK